MNKKSFSQAFVSLNLTLLMLTSFIIAPVYSLQIVYTIKLDKKPDCIAVNEATNRLYVGVEDGLVVIDCDSHTSIANITTEAEVIGLAINPQTNRIYAVVYRESVAVIDGTTNQIVDEIPEAINKTAYGVGIAVNPYTNLVYIEHRTTTWGFSDRVNVYDGETNQLVTSLIIPDSRYHIFIEEVGLAINPETNRIYVTWSGDDSMHMFDGNTNELIKTVELPRFMSKLIVNTYTGYVYEWDVVLDGETLEEVCSAYEGYIVEAVDPVHNLLYTLDHYNLYVLNGTTHEVVTSLNLEWQIDISARNVAVNSETDKVYLVNNSDNQIPVVLIPEVHTLICTMLLLIALAVMFLIYTRARDASKEN